MVTKSVIFEGNMIFSFHYFMDSGAIYTAAMYWKQVQIACLDTKYVEDTHRIQF